MSCERWESNRAACCSFTRRIAPCDPSRADRPAHRRAAERGGQRRNVGDAVVERRRRLPVRRRHDAGRLEPRRHRCDVRDLAGRRRSTHSFAFAAHGPEAAAITADPLPIPPHRLESPVGRVWEMDGQVLLLGVGHDSDTTIHLAEAFARVPYGVPKHITVMRDGRPVRIDYAENDHCCQRFTLADEWLRSRDLQSEGRVGQAHTRLVRSRDVVPSSESSSSAIHCSFSTRPRMGVPSATRRDVQCDEGSSTTLVSVPIGGTVIAISSPDCSVNSSGGMIAGAREQHAPSGKLVSR